ncbi:GGDEF domain-containing protein [Vibrio ulleungensis]|uniref:diguanylate cyclase n=1 Tax=Vibrio ulleungensis TaxID=2807619 RepID=A0ABS2HLI2_9VIBR|nr:GGDEF domain-containing protein [Vibrio ulleungensis]MBM7036732.1 GGDEF domain-containing protein [Vibrio ulleungensis]
MKRSSPLTLYSEFVYRHAYWVLLSGAMLFALVAFWGMPQLLPTYLIEWHDIFSELFVIGVMLYWIMITRQIKGGTRTFLYLYLGASSIVWLMVAKASAEWLVSPGIVMSAIELFLTITGLVMMTVGLRSWARDYNNLIRRLDKSVVRYRHRSQRDNLTGLYNRGEFESHLNNLIQSEEPFGLLLLDLDRFKTINDSYGHFAGDKVLKSVAQTFKNTLTLHDKAFRIGGEEFALVYRDITGSELAEKVEQCLVAVRNCEVHIEGAQTVNVTFSGGYIMSLDSRETVADLYQKADSALYHAKHYGRNQVVDALTLES